MLSGFGFYSPNIWSAFDAARKINGGNYSDEEVCGIMGVAWDLKRTYDDDTACRPQWVRITQDICDILLMGVRDCRMELLRACQVVPLDN